MKLILDMQVTDEFQRQIKKRLLRRAIEETLKNEGIDGTYEVSLVIADDKRMQELNRAYRGIDEPTDVLSFPLLEGSPLGDADEAFPLVSEGTQYLGDVVVSYPRVVKQAEEQGHSPDRELAFLVVHGVLHLLGYDDETNRGLEEMVDKGNAIVLKLGQF